MSNKVLNIYVKSEEDFEFDDFLEGSLNADDAFTIFSVSVETFNNRDSEGVYKDLKDKINENISLTESINPDSDLVLDKNFLKEMNKLDSKSFFDSFDVVSFVDIEISTIKSMIQNDLDFFKSKKICLPESYGFTRDDRLRVEKIVDDISSSFPKCSFEFLVNTSGNTLSVSIDDYYKSCDKIQSIVTLVKSLNLSPLEKIMFVYDEIKKREFKQENEDDNAFDSRDLTSALLGDKIVCVGFNVIFRTILNMLGINNISVKLDGVDSEDGHVRTCIYVDDLKYNVKGHYFFDVTWDSKTNDKSGNSYRFFLKTLEEMIKADKEVGLCFADDMYLYPNYIYKVFRTLKSSFSYSDFIEIGGKTRFNRFLKNMGEKEIKIDFDENDKAELISAYKKIYDSFNNSIDPLDFANLLYNVKRVEYYLDPTSTLFDERDLADAIINNTFSKFNRDENSINLLANLLGISIEEVENLEKVKLLKRTITPELKENIRRIKLTRTLREVLMKK